MTIKESITGGTAVLSFKGNFMGEPDATNVREKVHSLVSKDVKRFVIDLGGVNFINSSGLGALIATLTTVKNAKGNLKLACVNEKVHNLFVITQLVKVFDTYDTVEEALKSFR